MSAIAGWVSLDGRELGSLGPALESLAPHGIDGQAYVEWPGGSFAQSTTFLTQESRQESFPVRDHNCCLVADVRILDRQALLARLDAASASGDGALLIAAYRCWGISMVRQLRAEFSFALWDESAKRLFCARDPVGVRPLVFYQSPCRKRLSFASELPALMALPQVPDLFDEEEVARYLSRDEKVHLSETHTFYRELRKLPPGHWMTFDRSGLRIERYWHPENVARANLPDRDAVEGLALHLEDAVNCRLRSSYAVGAHLSGGLDSSSVAVIAARRLRAGGDPLQAFSWSWSPTIPGAGAAREVLRILALAQQESLTVHYLNSPSDWDYPPTYEDASLRPCQLLERETAVARTAQKLGVRLILSGWGGDEGVSFNGRGYRAQQFLSGQWWPLLKNLRGNHGSWLDYRSWYRIASGFWKQVWTVLLPDPLAERMPGFRSAPKDRFLRPAWAGLRPALSREYLGVRRNQIALLRKGHLANRLETWAWLGGQFGLYYSFPLLDSKLLEFAYSLDGHFYSRDGWNRWLYRKATEPLFPAGMTWNRFGPIKGEDMVHGSSAEQVRASLMPPPNVDADHSVPRADQRSWLESIESNPWIDVERLRRRLDSSTPMSQADWDAATKAMQVLNWYANWRKRINSAP